MIWLRFAPYIIAAVVVVGGVLYVRNLQSTVNEQAIRLEEAEVERTRLTEQLMAVTQERQALIEQSVKAGEERKRIQTQLDSTIRKLRAQRPPLECKAAVEWAVDQKADMEWETK